VPEQYYPDTFRDRDQQRAPAHAAPHDTPAHAAHAAHAAPRNSAGWTFAVIAVALLVAAVVFVGLQTSKIPTGTVEDRQAREEVQTPPEELAPAADGESGEGQPFELINQILVPEFAVWAPGTKIQSTDHYPQAGVTFTAQSCTVAFSFSDAHGRNFAVTAGHCGKEGDLVFPTNAVYATDYAQEAGRFIYSDLYSPGSEGVDVGIIEITDPNRYMEVVGDPIPTGIGEQLPPIEQVCKTGGTTGYTCGYFVETQRVQIVDTDVDDERPTFGDIAAVCAASGDSGGPVFTQVNGRAVVIGVVSGTEAGRTGEECWEGMENPKMMSYSNVEQLMSVVTKVVPEPAFTTQTW